MMICICGAVIQFDCYSLGNKVSFAIYTFSILCSGGILPSPQLTLGGPSQSLFRTWFGA